MVSSVFHRTINWKQAFLILIDFSLTIQKAIHHFQYAEFHAYHNSLTYKSQS